eukprot:scaffold4913_cov111-Isochrysis_galbana.AAC.5
MSRTTWISIIPPSHSRQGNGAAATAGVLTPRDPDWPSKTEGAGDWAAHVRRAAPRRRRTVEPGPLRGFQSAEGSGMSLFCVARSSEERAADHKGTRSRGAVLHLFYGGGVTGRQSDSVCSASAVAPLPARREVEINAGIAQTPSPAHSGLKKDKGMGKEWGGGRRVSGRLKDKGCPVVSPLGSSAFF